MTEGKRPPAGDRTLWAALLAAMAIFAILGARQADSLMVWHEETMVHVMPAPRIVAVEPDASGAIRMERSCADPDPPLFAVSNERPRLSVCGGGRVWPAIVARYFVGFLYWPFALLRGVHHDDVFALRKLALVIGMLNILVTAKVIARLAGRREAMVAALLMAVTPCFIVIHAALVHFETLPWTLLMLAVLVLLGCPELAPDSEKQGSPRTRPLALAGLLVGLAIAANLKTVVFLAALGLVAVRLRVRWRSIRADQWAAAAGAATVALLPMILTAILAPGGDAGDKSQHWDRTLIAHVTHPELFLQAIRDLVLVWSNYGVYFTENGEPKTITWAPAVVAALSAAHAIGAGGRALYRREGSAVAAASGACIAVFIAMIALIYDHFPANYTPLHAVFGAAAATAVIQAGSFIADRTGRAWTRGALVAAAGVSLLWGSLESERIFAGTNLYANPVAERAIVRYLMDHREPDVMHVIAAPQIPQVIDSLSGFTVRTVDAINYLLRCDPRVKNQDRATPCLRARWRALLDAEGGREKRVILAAEAASKTFDPRRLSLLPSLQEAAADLGRTVTAEIEVATSRGMPALVVYRIGPKGTK